MSLWDRLRGRSPVETRDVPIARPLSISELALFAGDGANGPAGAENLATIAAAIAAIARAMGSLPPLAYRREGKARLELANHWLTRLLRRPNRHSTWCDLVEWTLRSVLRHGNAVLVIELDGAGRPIALQPAPWPSIAMKLLGSGEVAYDVSAFPFGTPARPRRFLEGEVFHLRDGSDDGLVGRSVLSRSPDVIGNAIALQAWTKSTWANQATPSGSIESEAILSDKQRGQLQAALSERHRGTGNARSILLLDAGLKWKPLSVSPENAEVLESRRFAVEELARLYGVPAPIIGDLSHGTFTNAETMIRLFAQSCLSSWCAKFEAEFARSVLGEGNTDLEIMLDLSGLLRGDPVARWNTYDVAAKNGILDTNEIREIEGFNPKAAPAELGPVATS